MLKHAVSHMDFNYEPYAHGYVCFLFHICANDVVYNKSNLTSIVSGCGFTFYDPLVVWEGYQGSGHLLYEQFYRFYFLALHRVGPPFVEQLLSSPDPCHAQLCPS